MKNIITGTADRFECRCDLAGKWTVWDKIGDFAAALGGTPLVGLGHQRAHVARDILRKIYRARLDRQSIRDDCARLVSAIPNLLRNGVAVGGLAL